MASIRLKHVGMPTVRARLHATRDRDAGGAKYGDAVPEPTDVGQGWDSMATGESGKPMGLRKDTRDWLATHTIRDVREIVSDLQDAGEDVTDLLDAVDELERFVRADRRAGKEKAKV